MQGHDTPYMTLDEALDMFRDPYAGLAVLDLTTWTRLPEVERHARQRNITFADAVRELVNRGLSHGPRPL